MGKSWREKRVKHHKLSLTESELTVVGRALRDFHPLSPAEAHTRTVVMAKAINKLQRGLG